MNENNYDLEAAHDEGYDRGRADADRISAGLTPQRFNPYRAQRLNAEQTGT